MAQVDPNMQQSEMDPNMDPNVDYSQQYYQYQQQYYGSYGGYPASAYGTPSAPYSSYQYPTSAYPAHMASALYSAQNRNQQPSRSIWLGNIHPDTSEAEIRAEFAHFGLIESIKILPHKNCAFVNFAELETAITAHDNSYGKNIHGQEVKIGWGKADTNEPGTTTFKEGNVIPCKNLWIGNIGQDVGDEQLRAEFAAFGVIESIRILHHKNCAFINYSSIDAAINARNHLQGKVIGDRSIKINFGRDTTTTPAPGANPDAGPSPHSPAIEGKSAPWEAPPPPPKFAPAPRDPESKLVIDTLAKFVVRNGTQFENMMKEKEKNNPKLSFLFGGDGYDYYKWKVYCLAHDISADVPPQLPPGGYPQPPPPPQHPPPQPMYPPPPPPSQPPQPMSGQESVPFTPDQRKEFEEILDKLSGTKESIKNGKNWILDHIINAVDIAQCFTNKMFEFTDGDKKLHLIYLINDAIYHSMKSRATPAQLDPLGLAVRDQLVYILQGGLKDQNEENKDRIMKVLNLWATRNIYDTETVAKIKDGLTNPSYQAPVATMPWYSYAPMPWQSGYAQSDPQYSAAQANAALNEFYNEDKRQNESSQNEQKSSSSRNRSEESRNSSNDKKRTRSPSPSRDSRKKRNDYDDRGDHRRKSSGWDDAGEYSSSKK